MRDKGEEGRLRRLSAMYHLLRALVLPWFCLLFWYRWKKPPRVKGPCLVLANHNADLDPVFLALALPFHMVFVASEHIFRLGFLSKLLCTVFSPIPKRKGERDASTVREILRYLKKGVSVGLFPEGNRSFDGRTGAIDPSLYKLLRVCGATVVTCRFTGGYLLTPRWGKGRRFGPLACEVKGVYAPETLRALSQDAIKEKIEADLREDAFVSQKEKPHRYHAFAKAEHLQTALYLCPSCGGLGTLQTKGDRLFCSCGLETRLNAYGFFDPPRPFTTVRDWCDWQKQEARRRIMDGKAFLLRDEGLRFSRVRAEHRADFLCEGALELDRDHCLLGQERLPFSDITDIEIFGRQHLLISLRRGETVEIRADRPFNALCYRDLFDILRTLPDNKEGVTT